MGSHQGAKALKAEYLTPPEILKALGKFDLDPCAPIVRPWPMASSHYTIQDNGYTLPWKGRVWLNPPYGQETGKWLERLKEHGAGTALIFARTETDAWVNHVWEQASAILFLRKRIRFYQTDGTQLKENGGAPSALIAYGRTDMENLSRCGIAGKLILLNNP